MKQRLMRSLAPIRRSPIGKEGKGQGFETETQEVLGTYLAREGKGKVFKKETQDVLSSIESAYCLLKRLGKKHKKNREYLLLTTVTIGKHT